MRSCEPCSSGWPSGCAACERITARLSGCLEARPASCRHPLIPRTLVGAAAQGGGVRVNNERVGDELAVLSEEDLIDGRLVLIAAGKKNKMLVRLAA